MAETTNHITNRHKLKKIGCLKGTLIFWIINNLSITTVPAKRKKRVADSLAYSPKKGSPSQELKGIKNNPIKTNKRLKLILLCFCTASNDLNLCLIIVLI